jgi:hypothetical protein
MHWRLNYGTSAALATLAVLLLALGACALLTPLSTEADLNAGDGGGAVPTDETAPPDSSGGGTADTGRATPAPDASAAEAATGDEGVDGGGSDGGSDSGGSDGDSGGGGAQAGTLTAGSFDDNLNFDTFQGFLSDILQVEQDAAPDSPDLSLGQREIGRAHV